MAEGTDDRALPVTEELARARTALDAGDLTHAAGHLAGALARAPTMPEVHETLARLATASGSGGLDLFPLQHHTFVGAVVARAHLLAAAGRPAEGLDLLVAASAHAPGTNWAGVPWVTSPDLAERIGPDQAARVLMQVCAAAPDPVPPADRAALAPYLTLAHNAVTVHPEHALLLGTASALARRVGEVPLAVRWATRGVRAAPSKMGEVWLGYALRSAGRTREGLAALRRAVDHDPDDLAVYADIAGTLADHGRLEEALGWIEQALVRNPSFDCAVHTAHRLRFQRDGEVRHLVALADFIRDNPDDSHEHADLAECCRGRPWLGQLTPPPTADPALAPPSANSGIASPPTDPSTTSPSTDSGVASRPTDRALVSPPTDPALVSPPTDPAIVSPPAESDVASPSNGSVARPESSPAGGADPVRSAARRVPSPPSAEAARRLRELAHPAWPHPPAAYDTAVALATLDLTDLLGLLAHPPETPQTALGRVLSGQDPALWVRCVRVWTCLGLLHHRTDEPWASSTRRRVLVELAQAAEVTEAALFALVTAAWVDPAVRPDVARVVAERLTAVAEAAQAGRVSMAVSLAHLALATPDLDPDSLALARTLARVPARPGRGVLRALLRRLLRPFRPRLPGPPPP
ncbi:tetratricopeptide repeat protein [Micromonospora zingiberis]|uniref:Tetratricopeptide repeat protein n=1 Tax=Micromonospora zingiberis TaxID=2053011 RepID=A0A4R0GPQ2_9ACTN|nr:tetratricopeptide repeat protein [Micromonospora zingiberis]TCB97679.1 tetratricopeptide repeat protein [Micromonospora zingiberis]